MDNKGFTDMTDNIETPMEDIEFDTAEKPFKKKVNRVDINVLKSKLQQTEQKEFKKNIYILITLLSALGVLGIYLSL